MTQSLNYLEYPSAGPLRRLMALVYDSLILIALWLLVGFIHAAIVGVDNLQDPGQLQLTLFPALFGVTFLFYYWFWSHGGQTLGMRAWRIQVVDASLDGRAVNLVQSLSRFLAAVLSWGCFGLGYLWVLISPSGDSWHDSLSNTRTLLLPKDANKNLVPSKRTH